MKIDLKEFAAIKADGTYDLEGTVAKFAAECEEWIRFETESNGEVHVALTAALNKYPGANMQRPYVIGETLRELGSKVTPKTFGAYSEKANAMLDAYKERGIVEIAKGKGGGVKLVSAKPAE